MAQDDLKRGVARVAVRFVQEYLKPDAVIGLGTGSTVNYFIEALGQADFSLRGVVSSSNASTKRAEHVGLRVLDPTSSTRISLYVDGADELDPQGNLIKGGGGALMGEKIVAALSEGFLCLVDESKVVEQLGAFPLPVEVIPMAETHVRSELRRLGGTANRRENLITDNGNVILDVRDLAIRDPLELEDKLNQIVGVVENGIFARHRPFLSFVGRECCGVEAIGSSSDLEQCSNVLQQLDLCCATPRDQILHDNI